MSPSSRAVSVSSPLARAGHFLFKSRDLLLPLLLLLIGLGTWPRIVRSDMRVDHLTDAIGLLVSLTGQALRVLVIGLVYITRGGQNRQVWADSLVDGGMFAHSRNPLYVGNLLIILGLAIVHNGWAMYLVAMPVFMFFYTVIMFAEEEYLHERFGETYTEYRRRVPRWLPSPRGLGRTISEGDFDALKVVRKEYGTPFAWLSGFLLLLIWEHQSPSAKPIGVAELRSIAAIWITLALVYMTVRTMKLRGYLGTT